MIWSWKEKEERKPGRRLKTGRSRSGAFYMDFLRYKKPPIDPEMEMASDARDPSNHTDTSIVRVAPEDPQRGTEESLHFFS
jgi:hypothetical protein